MICLNNRFSIDYIFGSITAYCESTIFHSIFVKHKKTHLYSKNIKLYENFYSFNQGNRSFGMSYFQ